MSNTRIAYMLTGGGTSGLTGHLFDSLDEAEFWLSQGLVAKSYGLKEVVVSPRYCNHCKLPRPKVIRPIHKVGGFTGVESPPAEPVS